MQAHLTILGSSSATPTRERFHSGQYLTFRSECILIDCGEGTQNRMLQFGLNFQKINTILISHMHGDHYLGLPGLINSMALNRRVKPLHVYGPKGLRQMLDLHFQLGDTKLSFDLHVNEIVAFNTIQLQALSVTFIPVVHRIPCFAFKISEINIQRKLNVAACERHKVPVSFYSDIKLGSNYTNADGVTVMNNELTFDPNSPFSYGYITDTLYKPELAQYFKHIHLLYHEATYLSDLLDRAIMTSHSTASQAASFAVESSANQLIIGHFSSRYDTLEDHLKEAKTIFSNTELAVEGKSFLID